jgi:hypothetical protein
MVMMEMIQVKNPTKQPHSEEVRAKLKMMHDGTNIAMRK